MKTKIRLLAITLLNVMLITSLPCEVQAKATDTQAYCTDNMASISSILKVCGLTSTPEQSMSASQIRTDSKVNPYDVIWDYGKDWDSYVDACDWSLVFNADYYMKQFPMLAMQYHYDKDLLLRHFQTVGVHEGRQGCDSFNVDAYNKNCSYAVYKAFHNHCEGYYLYYMLHYDTEKDVNTVSTNEDSPVRDKVCDILTLAQQKELDKINVYRNEVGSAPVEYNAELAAIASYRAYINVTENIEGHDWLDMNGNTDTQVSWIVTATKGLSPGSFSENNYESSGGITKMPRKIFADAYASCKSHNEAMRRPSQKWVGIGNMVWDGTYNTWDEQFDIYAR